ncbi:MAG: hypothetical protein GY868_07055 [Deltaproteobacteria bacterium]|nr:hypothetical protein [Deltaproteobacteria bacterium]
MTFKPECIATAIGSFPHTDPAAVCELIMNTIPEIPCWPQLPNMDFREQMDFQYSEGIPRVIINAAEKKMHIDTSGDFSSDFETFYTQFLSENNAHCAMTPAFSRGIFAFEDKLKQIDTSKIAYIKTQITGPVTFGMSVKDESKKDIFYNELFRDVIIKAITMKARWMVHHFKQFGCNQICFVDEPVLTGFGSSAYVTLQREDVVNSMREVIDALHQDNVLIGTHCCGNTDWTILIEAGVDMVNFDAYEFGDTIAYYPEQVQAFLEKGGVLACGIVPTSGKIADETPDSLVRKLDAVFDNLAAKGIPKSLILEQCLLTPSCGTGSLSIELSEKVMHTLAEVSRLMRK